MSRLVLPDDHDTDDVSAMVCSVLGISRDEYERNVERGRVLFASRLRKRQRKARPTLASVAKQASKAAIEVARYEIKPDGSIVVVTGKATNNTADTPEGSSRTYDTAAISFAPAPLRVAQAAQRRSRWP
jgi:hypothetical protein